MHRTTIVQNKIISIICSRLFFCPANIYRPSLGKVRLGRPNSKPIQALNIYLRRKRPLYSELYALQWYRAQFSILIFICLKKKCFLSKNVSKFWTIYIIIYIFFFWKIGLCTVVVKCVLMSMQLISTWSDG